MSRIVHGFHITKKRKHKKTFAFFLFFFLAVISVVIFYSENSGSFLFTNLLLSLYRLIIAYLLSLFVALTIAIFEEGVVFFAEATTEGDRALSERLTRKNMRALPYWKSHPFKKLDGPEATDAEFETAMAKL